METRSVNYSFSRSKQVHKSQMIFGGLALLVSILLHLATFWKASELLLKAEKLFPAQKKESSQTSLEREKTMQTLIVSPQELQKLTVETRRARLEESVSQSEGPVFAGESTQRVRHQSVAKNFGSVEGRPHKNNLQSSELTDSAEKSSAASSELQALGLSSSLSSLVLNSRTRPPKTDQAKKVQQNENSESHQASLRSGSFDAIPRDISVGMQTLLNTDEYKFSGFFNRFKREVAPRWEPLVEQAARSQKKMNSGIFQTQTAIILDAAGEIKEVYVTKSSGNKLIDEAARSALELVLRVKNPPKELQQADGHYRLNMGFIYEISSGGIKMEYVTDPRLLNPQAF